MAMCDFYAFSFHVCSIFVKKTKKNKGGHFRDSWPTAVPGPGAAPPPAVSQSRIKPPCHVLPVNALIRCAPAPQPRFPTVRALA